MAFYVNPNQEDSEEAHERYTTAMSPQRRKVLQLRRIGRGEAEVEELRRKYCNRYSYLRPGGRLRSWACILRDSGRKAWPTVS